MVYIDAEFKCHAADSNGTLLACDVPFFDDKCSTFIEGYIYVPDGEEWTHPNGFVCHGEMRVPWKPYDHLAAAQAQYEADLAEAAAAYQEGVNSAYDQ